MNKLFRFEFWVWEPLTTEQANLVLPAVRALLKREGLEPNHGELTPTDDGQWMMRGSTANLDYDALLKRHIGSAIYYWQESVEAALKKIVMDANSTARASSSWLYSDDDDFYDE
ncbi:hypothetical protein [Nocardia sp. NPDC005825]|uniref:hypothetical protein n=1 Tax=unclassified Nocardia TaxID=2637762 RepID=UPI0033F1AB9C